MNKTTTSRRTLKMNKENMVNGTAVTTSCIHRRVKSERCVLAPIDTNVSRAEMRLAGQKNKLPIKVVLSNAIKYLDRPALRLNIYSLLSPKPVKPKIQINIKHRPNVCCKEIRGNTTVPTPTLSPRTVSSLYCTWRRSLDTALRRPSTGTSLNSTQTEGTGIIRKPRWYEKKPRILISQYYRHNFIESVRKAQSRGDSEAIKRVTISELLNDRKDEIQKVQKAWLRIERSKFDS